MDHTSSYKDISTDALGEQIAEDVAHLDAAHHRVLTKLRIFDDAGGWMKQGFRSCPQWLSWRVGFTLTTAREHVRVANALGVLPVVDEALRLGRLSYSKVRAITRVANPANEATLLEQALLLTGYQLDTLCRKFASVQDHDSAAPRPRDDLERRHVTRRDTADGMVRIEAVLHPEEAAVVWAALDRIAKQGCRASDDHTDHGSSACDGAGRASATATATATVTATVSASASATVTATATAMGTSAEAPAPAPGPGCVDAVLTHGHASPQAATSTLASLQAATPTRASLQAATPTLASPQAVTPTLAFPQAATPTPACFDRAAISGPPSAEAMRPEPAPDGHVRHDATEARAPRGVTVSVSGGIVLEGSLRPAAFSRADALVTMAEDVIRGHRQHRSPVELMISIPLEAMQHTTSRIASGSESGSEDPSLIGCCVDGTAISSACVRRLACDSGLVAVLEDTQGNSLAVGRKLRSVSGAMKRALLRRDQTCRFPGCRSRMFLEAHHIKHWADGGETHLSNLLSTCSFHHRFMHEYGFTIELHDDGTVTARDPAGRAIAESPSLPCPVDLGWPNIEERNTELRITAESIACWDGTPVDYGELVAELFRSEDRATAELA